MLPATDMYSSLFRKLGAFAICLLVATLLLIAYALRDEAGSARLRTLLIVTVATVVAGVVGLAVTRSLADRVRNLKSLAEQLVPDTAAAAAFDEGDDLASLERSFVRVSKELQAQVSNLRFESARREAVLEGMSEGVLAVDPDLRVTFTNPAMLRAIGFRGESHQGLGLLEFVRDPALYESIREVLASGRPRTLRFTLSADKPRTFEVAASAIHMPSGRGALAIFHDITDLERLEQVRKDFVANVSHELRTPLTGIIGYADTLLDGALDDDANRRRFVEIIRSNAVRLGSIAADLLVLSELESGSEQVDGERISVRAVLEGALLTVQGEAAMRGVQLVRERVDDVFALGSRLRLEQALLNLLANAIKFNKDGGEVRVRAVADAGRVAISVADTGVGIPSQDLPRIFERFYRVDKARSREVGGTGLGLSIVKHVVERMQGTIEVSSQLGRGTTFVIQVPRA